MPARCCRRAFRSPGPPSCSRATAGFLAAVLPKGKRAITIPVDEIAGLSGLALPGDRVDLILTYSVAGDRRRRLIRASETVI